MNTGKMIVGSTLILSWAGMLSARAIAAAIYATTPGHSYSFGLKHVGWLFPLSAWACFAAGVAVLLAYGGFQKNRIPSSDQPAVPSRPPNPA